MTGFCVEIYKNSFGIQFEGQIESTDAVDKFVIIANSEPISARIRLILKERHSIDFEVVIPFVYLSNSSVYTAKIIPTDIVE